MLQVVTLYYGGHLVIKYEMTGGELVSLLLYQVSLSAAIDVSNYFKTNCYYYIHVHTYMYIQYKSKQQLGIIIMIVLKTRSFAILRVIHM